MKIIEEVILLKDNMKFAEKGSIIDNDGRYIMLRITVCELTFVLINIYAPNNEAEHALFLQEVNDR